MVFGKKKKVIEEVQAGVTEINMGSAGVELEQAKNIEHGLPHEKTQHEQVLKNLSPDLKETIQYLQAEYSGIYNTPPIASAQRDEMNTLLLAMLNELRILNKQVRESNENG
jgi:hypothetical protein